MKVSAQPQIILQLPLQQEPQIGIHKEQGRVSTQPKLQNPARRKTIRQLLPNLLLQARPTILVKQQNKINHLRISLRPPLPLPPSNLVCRLCHILQISTGTIYAELTSTALVSYSWEVWDSELSATWASVSLSSDSDPIYLNIFIQYHWSYPLHRLMLSLMSCKIMVHSL